MTDLRSSPVLRIEQQSSQLEYVLADDDEQVVGRASQVAGRTPRKGLLGMVLGSGLGGARVVVQVCGADGVPLFYVDHQDGAPTAVVAVDGGVIGRLVYDRLGVAQEMSAGGVAAGTMRMAFGRPVLRHRLEDPGNRVLCELVWTFRPRGDVDDRQWNPKACDYVDPHGTHIAHADVHPATFRDRYVLRLAYQLPEPLRTLVVASPLAYDLSQS